MKQGGSHRADVDTHGGGSAANLAAQALASLTSKLAALERDNANSAARVAELEARLAATTAERERERGRGQSDDRQLEEEARRVRREVEILLGDERARREGEFSVLSPRRITRWLH